MQKWQAAKSSLPFLCAPPLLVSVVSLQLVSTSAHLSDVQPPVQQLHGAPLP
jgi:hypothetical protein